LLAASPVTVSTVCATHPELCGVVCGAACVDLTRDPDNCGGCGVACAPRAACNDGQCGLEPGLLVAPTPGCRSIRLVYENGAITWADLGHGTIKRVATAGGAATMLASGLHLAAIHVGADQPLLAYDQPVGAGIIVRSGVVYWIGAADEVTRDAAGLPHGGGGTTILSVFTGGAPVTLLAPELAPGPSPISSATDAGNPIESPSVKPPISAIALSPDGATLYFAAGTRLYKIPNAGAVTPADVQLVGFTAGPEQGFATALAADDRRLFFPSTNDEVEMFDMTQPCDPAAAPSYACPSFVFGSTPTPLPDTIADDGHFVAWAKENNVWRADLRAADPSVDGHAIFSDTVEGYDVSGFAVGAVNAYFGEDTLVETGSFADVVNGNPPRARVIARAQPRPSSFALDGTNVYWTTANCDVAFLADSPQ
jgi:hypothetical protein